MKQSSLLLALVTVFLGVATLPALAFQDDPPPRPAIRSVTPFSLKEASGGGCPNAGGGCVITIFEDGTVTATNVD